VHDGNGHVNANESGQISGRRDSGRRRAAMQRVVSGRSRVNATESRIACAALGVFLATHVGCGATRRLLSREALANGHHRSAVRDASAMRSNPHGISQGRIDALLADPNVPPADASDRLRALLREPFDADSRGRLRRALWSLRDPRAADAMQDALGEGGDAARDAAIAIVALSRDQVQSLRDPLASALAHARAPDARAAVAWALVMLDDPRGDAALDDAFRSGALFELRTFDSPPDALFDDSRFAQHAGADRIERLADSPNATSRRRALVAATYLPDAQRDALLGRVAADRTRVANADALVLLARVASDRAVPVLRSARQAAADAPALAERVVRHAGVNGLQAVLSGTPNDAVRVAAIGAIVTVRDRAAADVVDGAFPAGIGTRSRDVRAAVIRALAALHDVRAAARLRATSTPRAPGELAVAFDRVTRPRVACESAPISRARADVPGSTTGTALHAIPCVTQRDGRAPSAAWRMTTAQVRVSLASMRAGANDPDGTRAASLIAAAWLRDAQSVAPLLAIAESAAATMTDRVLAATAIRASVDTASTPTVLAALARATTADARAVISVALGSAYPESVALSVLTAAASPGVSLPTAQAVLIGHACSPATAAALEALIAQVGTLPARAWMPALFCRAESLDDAIARALPSVPTGDPVVRGPAAAVDIATRMLDLRSFYDGSFFHLWSRAQRLAGDRLHPFSWLRERLLDAIHSMDDGALTPEWFDVRTRIREAAMHSDSFRRAAAFDLLVALDDRGSMHALARGAGWSADHARRALERWFVEER